MAAITFPKRNKTQELERMKHAASQARLPFDKDVLLNVAFFLGHQYVEWNAGAGSLRMIPREDKTPRPVSNKIMHFVMQEHAYALTDKPTVDVHPATASPNDISIANVALAYLRSVCEPQQADFDSELSDAVFWALLGGEGYLKWIYDPVQKRPDVIAVSPLDLYVDPYARKFRTARWVIHEQFMDVQEIEDVYGVKVKPTKADSDRVTLLREMGQAPILEGAVVNELWIKPQPGRYEKGLFVVWCGKEILVEPQPFPYAHGQLPFTQFGVIPRPKTPHYTCPVQYLRSGQMELNKYHAQKLINRETFANAKWWIPAELELESDPNDSTRQILRGSGSSGLQPTLIQGEVMRDNGDGDWIRQEMQDVVGLHEVSQAQVPGRVEAARAIELLKESDLSRLDMLRGTIKSGLSQGFWQWLMLAKQFVSAEVIVQTYSPEGFPEVRKLKATELKPAMRVRVTIGNGISRSRAARQEVAIQLWQNQIIRDPEIFAQIVEIPIEAVSPQRAYDMKLARNENLLIASGGAGTAVTPNSWDAHDVHIREHNNYRKTAEFQSLSEDTQKKFEFHVQMHDEMELQQLQKMAEKQLVMQGAAMGAQAGAQQAQAEQEQSSPQQ